MVELKLCRCGAKPKRRTAFINYMWQYWVECPKCGARVPPEDKPEYADSEWNDTQEVHNA